MRRATFLVIVPLVLAATRAAASDFNPFGFYIGGAVGKAAVRSSISIQPPYEFDEHDTGWKVLVGLRPIELFAAELEYVDFGHPSSTSQMGAFALYSDVLQRATTLSGLLYLPIPLSVLDVYARAGLARLESSGSPYLVCTGPGPCPLIIPLPNFQFNRTDTDFLYGAGVQLKMSAIAVRLEYERINHSSGNPDMLSIGVTWTF